MKVIVVAKGFFLSPLTLTLSPRRGEREEEEETFGKPYKGSSSCFLAEPSGPVLVPGGGLGKVEPGAGKIARRHRWGVPLILLAKLLTYRYISNI
jgi:hypothetical protein